MSIFKKYIKTTIGVLSIIALFAGLYQDLVKDLFSFIKTTLTPKDNTLFFTKESPKFVFVKGLYAKENNSIYELIPLKDESCLNIEAQKDFDNNGKKDVLISYNICGGNAIGDTFSIQLNYGNGNFKIKDFPEDSWSWKKPIIQKWKDRWSITIITASDGVGHTSLEQNTHTYIINNNGEIKEIISAKKFNIKANIEVYSSELNQNIKDDSYDKKQIIYDLNDDGQNELIKFKYWERWGAMFSYIKLPNGKWQDLHIGCKRIGVLKSKTNGMHDLVCNEDIIIKWNGKRYANDNKSLDDE